ncbi:MAG: hypothetical protein MHMPM18_003912 [Marteilia pararefringens]
MHTAKAISCAVLPRCAQQFHIVLLVYLKMNILLNYFATLACYALTVDGGNARRRARKVLELNILGENDRLVKLREEKNLLMTNVSRELLIRFHFIRNIYNNS